MILFTFNTLRSIFKLYGSGETLEELIQILKQYNVDDIVSVIIFILGNITIGIQALHRPQALYSRLGPSQEKSRERRTWDICSISNVFSVLVLCTQVNMMLVMLL